MASTQTATEARKARSRKEFLGKGCCGKVHALSDNSGGNIAWKEFDSRAIDRYWVGEFDRRYRAIGERHPGILHRHGSNFSRSPAICISDLAIGNDGTCLTAKALDSLAIWTSEEKIWPYLVDLAAACAFLHTNHIVYGNLHPANVFIDQGGASRVAISDFGQGLLGHLDHFEFTDGTWFAPPEQLRSPESIADHQGLRWDVYRFGVIAFWLINGTLPRGEKFSREALAAMQKAQQSKRRRSAGRQEEEKIDRIAFAHAIENSSAPTWNKKPANTELAELRTIVDECLAVERRARPADMREVYDRFLRLETAGKLREADQRVAEERRRQKSKLFTTRAAFLGAAVVAAFAIFGFVRYFDASKTFRGEIGELSATIDQQHKQAGEITQRLESTRQDLRTSSAATDRFFAAGIADDIVSSGSITQAGREETRAYYEGILINSGSDASASLETARARRGLARLDAKSVPPEQAANGLIESIAALESLLANHPITPSETVDVHLRLADCHETLSRMHAVDPSEDVLNSLSEAVKHIGAARGNQPGNQKFIWQHAVLDHHLAIQMHAQRRFEDAIDTQGAAANLLASFEPSEDGRYVISFSDRRRLQANIDFQIAQSLHALRRSPEATDSYLAAMETLTTSDPSATAPEETPLHYADSVLLARCYGEVGKIFAVEKDATKAAEILNAAIELLTPLFEAGSEARHKASSAYEYQIGAAISLAGCYRHLAILTGRIGRWNDSLALHRKGLAILETTIAAQPDRFDLLFANIEADTACARHFGSGSYADRHADLAFEQVEQLSAVVSREATSLGQGPQQTRLIQLAQLYAGLGDLSVDLRDNARAADCFSIAVGNWTLLADNNSESWIRDLLSETQSRLERVRQ